MLRNKDVQSGKAGRNAGISIVLDILEHWKGHPKDERLECLGTVLGYLFAWTWDEFGDEWVSKAAEKIHRIMAITGATPREQKDATSTLFGLVSYLADVCPHPSAKDPKKQSSREEPHRCTKKGCNDEAEVTIQHHFGTELPQNICVCGPHAKLTLEVLSELLHRLGKKDGPVAITIWPRSTEEKK